MNQLPQEVINQATEILDAMEDFVSSYCNQEQVSGQRVWAMISGLAEVKLNEFPDTSIYGE